MRTVVMVATVLALTASQADAQQRRRSYNPGQPAYGPVQEPRGRVQQQYSRPPGGDGVIRWNTPNADGNFGGPGGGGSAGGTT